MRKFLAFAGSVLMFATLATPAQSAGTEYWSSQKTLQPFYGAMTQLTADQKKEVELAVLTNPLADKFICTGIRYAKDPAKVNVQVRARAKAACDYAKTLNPNLSTWFQNKPTNAKSYAGKVLLTVKSEMFKAIPPTIDSPVTWDTLLTRSDELPEIFYNDVYKTIERNKETYSSYAVPYAIYRGPNLAAFHYADIDSWLDDLAAFYARAVKPDRQDFLAFPQKDLEWAVKVAKSAPVSDPGYEDILRFVNSTPAQGIRQNLKARYQPNNIMLGTFEGIWILPATLGPIPGAYDSYAQHEMDAVTHEQAHQIQQAQYKRGDYFSIETKRVAPCFLEEGTTLLPKALVHPTAAEFKKAVEGMVRGAYISDPDTRDQFGNFTRTINLTEEVTVKFASDYLNNSRRSISPECNIESQYGLAYTLGYLATEALVAIKGAESPMALYTLMGNFNMSFEEAFLKIYDITWEQALPKLAAYVSKKAMEYRR